MTNMIIGRPIYMEPNVHVCTYFANIQDGKLIQKLMIDEKNFYLFGRNHQTCDFVVDHGSCSRWDNLKNWKDSLKILTQSSCCTSLAQTLGEKFSC